MREPLVSITRCETKDWQNSVFPAVKEAVDKIGGMETVISTGDTVLLKPNWLFPVSYETGAVTNPAVIESVISLVKGAGAKRIIVADGAAVGRSTREVFESETYGSLRGLGVEVVDFKEGEYVWVANPGAVLFRRIRIPRIFLETNVVINLPVMKTHDALPATLGLKNMKGVIHEQDKKRFHKWGLEQSLVDLNRIALPEMTILDGTIGMEGLGPLFGDPVNLGIVMASTDTVALDAVAAAVMGIDVRSVTYLRMAAEAGLGCADLNEIEVVGCSIEEVRRPFAQTSLSEDEFSSYDIEIIQDGACSGCNHSIESGVRRLEKQGGIEKLTGYTIVYGQSARPPEYTNRKLLLIGTCMRTYKDRGIYIPGCPPHVLDFKKAIGA